MRRLREHVNRLDVPDFVLLHQHLTVFCQGGRVAGNVDEPLRFRFQNRLQQFRIQARPGRIHHDDIRPESLLDHIDQYLFCGPRYKTGILNPRSPCIVFGVFNRFRNDVDPDNFFCARRQPEGDGSHPAIGVTTVSVPLNAAASDTRLYSL